MRTNHNSIGTTRYTDCNTLQGAYVNAVAVTTMQEAATMVANNVVDVREKSQHFACMLSLQIHVTTLTQNTFPSTIPYSWIAYKTYRKSFDGI